MLDIVVKNALTNGLLYYFVMQNQWEMLIVLFSLNYVVSKSFLSKQENRQNEIERDYFREMAYTDFMTGLANRAMMDKQMSEINGSNEVLGIVVIDIDKFKRINDNFNHAVGDLVIQHFAKMLKSRARNTDQVFRSGGEEFTLFLRDRTYEECIECLEGLRTQVSEQPAEVEFNGEMTQISYTVSCGLYYNAMVEELPMERAYIYADQLLLEAKGRGRNRLVVKNGLETYK
jgi:diguanylate cyclase (GGDEF)-like protein